MGGGNHWGQRISVVGTTGTGKTTTAREISKRLNLLHIELDALYWAENWTGVPDEVFEARVLEAIAGDQWVVDGNYSRVRSLVWARAETVVYLDFSFGRVFWQLLRRTLRRSFTKEELWHGNRETIKNSMFSQDSIMVWMLTTYHRRRRQYTARFQQPEYAHLRVVHLKTPKERDAWLASLSSES
ncbi:MAG: adenylate kinase [Anaerolineales bacterium]|nr:adenylate kinase [Anaerolineales bacterium]